MKLNLSRILGLICLGLYIYAIIDENHLAVVGYLVNIFLLAERDVTLGGEAKERNPAPLTVEEVPGTYSITLKNSDAEDLRDAVGLTYQRQSEIFLLTHLAYHKQVIAAAEEGAPHVSFGRVLEDVTRQARNQNDLMIMPVTAKYIFEDESQIPRSDVNFHKGFVRYIEREITKLKNT